MNSSMARRLELLEAQVTGATLTDEQREADAAEATGRFWRDLQARGEHLRDYPARTAEALDHESARDLVARLVVPGEVAPGLVVAALRRRIATFEEAGEGAVAGFLRWVLEQTHEAGAEGEDRHE